MTNNASPEIASRSLDNVKVLGGVGSILALLAFLPVVGIVISIVGLILVLVALKYASDVLGDPRIFNDMLYAVVLGIVGIVVGIVGVAAFVYRAIGLRYLSSPYAYTPTAYAPGDVMGTIGTVLIGIVAIWACFLVSSIFLRRSYDELGNRLNVNLFGTAAVIYLIGAVLTIVLIGFLLIFVAEVLLIAAFFSINTQLPPRPPSVLPAQSSI